jgi:hypothetical protein
MADFKALWMKRKRPPTEAAFPALAQTCGVLLERSRDGIERVVQLSAQAIDDRDDCNGNAGGNQAVFDCGSARTIFQETQNILVHG